MVVGFLVGDRVGDLVGMCEGLQDEDADGTTDCEFEGELLAALFSPKLEEGVREIVGFCERLDDGDFEGDLDGYFDAEGDLDGDLDGDMIGKIDGMLLGALESKAPREVVSKTVCSVEGQADDVFEGKMLGEVVLTRELEDGDFVGQMDGGELLGAREGV